MCGTRLAENAGPKKVTKNCHLGTIAQLCRATSSQNVSTVGKKLLNSNISSTCPQSMVNFGPLGAEIVSLVWGTSANFDLFHILVLLLQCRRSTAANHTLHDVWPSPGLIHYIYTFGGSCPVILLGATFTLRPSFALSYFGSITAQHSSSGRQPNFAALNRWRHLYSAGRPSRWALAHILVLF